MVVNKVDGMNVEYETFYKPIEIPDEYRSLPDRVAETFTGKTIFMTGATGFLGKVLLEKILRKSPNVKRIYILMRQKKGKNAKQRIEELFTSPLFTLLKTTHGEKIIHKALPISGNVEEIGLGLSDTERQTLINEVDIVIHGAATIRFDEPLRKAVLLNTRGTQMMLKLAKQMKRMEVFVHISTAYCHLEQKVLYEKPYPPPTDPTKLIAKLEAMTEEAVEKQARALLGDCPNSYSYTKCLSEGLVVEEMNKGMPCLVLRPSIIIPIWREPLPGWTDNINGPTGLLIGAGKGVIRTMFCDNTGYADFLPVDITINGIFLGTWAYLTQKEHRQSICHLTSSQEWQVSWQEIIDIGKSIVTTEVPLNGCVWYPGGSMKTSRLLHQICVIFFHIIPAYFLDAIIFLSGNKPCLVKIQDRISKGFEVFEYYANNQWEFKNDYVHVIRKLMNKRERMEYKIDGEDLDIRKYFQDCIMATRIFILKEMPDTLPSARRHMRIMYWVDVIAKVLFFGFILYTLSSYSETLRSLFRVLFSIVQYVGGLFVSSGPKATLTEL
uniref:Fatty acyl-CoA reductase n=1 Tax=Cacopsylla melanoneura TaxID=428564 RepID=A0A8D8YXS6_9HEMI